MARAGSIDGQDHSVEPGSRDEMGWEPPRRRLGTGDCVLHLLGGSGAIGVALVGGQVAEVAAPASGAGTGGMTKAPRAPESGTGSANGSWPAVRVTAGSASVRNRMIHADRAAALA